MTKKSILFFLAILIVVAKLEILAVEILDIKVKEKAWVKEEKVFLFDIASINAPAYLNKKIRTIYIVQAPKPGKEIKLNGNWIKSKISSSLRDYKINIKVPETVIIFRASQKIADNKFYDLFNQYIFKQAQKGVDFEIKRFKVMGNHLIPAGHVDIEIIRQSQEQLKGYVSVNAIVKVSGKFIQKVIITAWIDRFEKIACTSKRLKRNTILTEEDFFIEKRNVSRVNESVITKAEEIIGNRLKRATEAGAIISYKMIEKPPIIQKGDKVTIIAESKNLLIKAVGIAQSKGYKGDQITVKNIMSNKKVQATVIDETTVSVVY